MCSAKVFLLGSILKFGGNPAQLRRLIQQNWFQRVDRLGKAAFLAAEMKDGGESGIRTHVTLSSKHAFQACAFSHSAISPSCIGWKERLLRSSRFSILLNSMGVVVETAT